MNNLSFQYFWFACRLFDYKRYDFSLYCFAFKIYEHLFETNYFFLTYFLERKKTFLTIFFGNLKIYQMTQNGVIFRYDILDIFNNLLGKIILYFYFFRLA